MAIDVQRSGVGQLQGQRDVQNQEQNKEIGDKGKGVIAKGVGMFKKMWLHMTGKAGNRHSQQLTNLRAQVKTKFGDDGLKHLNEALKKKGFATDTDIKKDTSTKLLSDSEIKSLMGSVEIDKMVSDRAKKLAKDPEGVLPNPKLLQALHEFSKKEFSTENTGFIIAMNGISEDSSLDEVIGLYEKFIPSGSNQEINLPSELSDPLKEKFKALQTAMHNDDNDAIDRTKKDLINALNGAKKEIVKLVSRDTMLRAYKDPDFVKAVHDHVYNEVKNEVLQENLNKLGLV